MQFLEEANPLHIPLRIRIAKSSSSARKFFRLTRLGLCMKRTNNKIKRKQKIISLGNQPQKAVQLLLQLQIEQVQMYSSSKRRRAEKIAPSCPL